MFCWWWQNKGQSFKVKNLYLDFLTVRKKFLTKRAMRHWSKLPREVHHQKCSRSGRGFDQTDLSKETHGCFALFQPLGVLKRGVVNGWTWWSLKMDSNPKRSMILWLCLIRILADKTVHTEQSWNSSIFLQEISWDLKVITLDLHVKLCLWKKKRNSYPNSQKIKDHDSWIYKKSCALWLLSSSQLSYNLIFTWYLSSKFQCFLYESHCL